MADIKLFDDELDHQLKDLLKGVTDITKLKDAARTDKINHCDYLVSKIRTTFESYELELNECYGEQERLYKKKLDEYKTRFDELINDLNWKRTEQKKDALFAGRSKDKGAGVAAAPTNPDQMSYQQVIELGDRTQDQSLESLKRTRQLVEQSREVGAAAAAKLDEQTDQIAKIHDDLRDIESTLKRADRIIRGILRRAATDKVTRVFMVLVFLVIVFIIVWKSLGKDKNNNFNAPDVIPKVN